MPHLINRSVRHPTALARHTSQEQDKDRKDEVMGDRHLDRFIL
jgi:hypothetical protein